MSHQYFIFRFSILIFILSCACSKEIVEKVSTWDYIYVNQSGVPIEIKLYNKNKYNYKNYALASNDSISIRLTANPAPQPFKLSEFAKDTPDSSSVVFNNSKYLNYRFSYVDGEGYFNIKNYENYERIDLTKRFVRLRYIFTTMQYDTAKPLP